MLQLRRVRLESVGHPNARFAPLELRLTGEDHRPTHTVLWLRNGGGKSSLLNLIFAVVRPHRREFLGGNDEGKDRRLADYVLAGDTGHVYLEWGQPGARTPALVTGMTLEWRDRVRATDESRLRRLWYAFVPSDHRGPGLLDLEPTLTFDTLPISEDGRRLSLARFRERLRAIADRDVSLRLVTPTSQTEWRRELEQHDLDPEVLRYQLQMNREEGGASELFKRRCRTESDFVDMLLELAVADERTDRVADVYTRYADELARRPDVERNRDFLGGALERLAPVAAADAERSAADSSLHAVLGDVAATVAALRSAADAARARSAAADEQVRTHRADAEVHAQRERWLRARAAAANRRAADLEVAAAQERLESATTRLVTAQDHLATAVILEPMARRLQLDAEIATLDQQLGSDQPEAAGQLRHALGQLTARLRTEVRRSADAAHEQRRRAIACQEQADRAGAEAHEATVEHGRIEQARATAADRRAAWHRRRDQLRQRGALRDGESVDTARTRVADELAAARRRLAERMRDRDVLEDRIRDAYARLSALDGALGDARARAGAREHDRTQMHAAAAAVAGDARVRELAETDQVDLWDAGGMLVERLDALVDDADRRLADEAATVTADRAAVVALQTDGLLPARPAVQTVLGVLHEAGIAAVAGWRYLAEQVPAAQRADLLAGLPTIVDGVVVADRDDLHRARDALSGAEQLGSVVVVGPPPDGTSIPGPGPGVLAPVDPALYDRAHAEHARARRGQRLADAERRRGALLSARDRDAALADRIRRLLAAYPPQRRTAIDDDADLARRDCDRLRIEREALTAQLDDLTATRASRATDDPHAADAVQRHTMVLAELAALAADDVEDAADHELQHRADDARNRAAAATSRADELRTAAAAHLVTAQRHADDVERLRDELAQISLSQGDAAADDAATESLDLLRRRVHALRDTAAAGRSSHAVDERRRLLLERRSEIDRELAGVDDRTAAEAAAQLRAPEGQTRRARVDAVRAAEQARDAALGARAEAAERVRAARAARDQLPDAPLWIDDPGDVGDDPVLETLRSPADHEIDSAAAARRRLAQLLDAADAAQRGAVRARRQIDEAQQEARVHLGVAQHHEHLGELLTVELRGRDVPTVTGTSATATAAFDPSGDLAHARAVIDELRARIGEHVGRADRAARAVAQAAGDVRRFVIDARFSTLDGPIRARLSGEPVAVTRDEMLMEQLRVRLTQCEQKLHELASHRRLLVREISADTQRGLWLLRQADQVSSLPDGFGEWSGQRFLHIRFAAPAVDEELDERLEAMVDRLVDDGIRPAGVPLLQRATHAAVGPHGFGVRILKPNPALRPERVPVTELATFSGGEQLTAAILLYCTLARLRAQARQTQTAAGMLTLDNPIGKSSNVTLLQLQRRVADAMGVQLVYTTAVDDREAVGVLPHWIRLRNERRDIRTGNQHVEQVAGPADDVDGRAVGEVAATHMWRRGDAVAPAPGIR